jgi:hypothetical protein
MRIKSLVGFGLLFSLLTSNGSASIESFENVSTARLYTNILAGDLSISTSSLGFGLASDSKFFLTMKPRIEYFVLDRLALGLQTQWSTNLSNDTRFSLGPAITYHFWASKMLSAYAGACYLFPSYGNSPSQTTRSHSVDFSLGGNYNVTPWFGLGPRISYILEKDRTSFDLSIINLFFYL